MSIPSANLFQAPAAASVTLSEDWQFSVGDSAGTGSEAWQKVTIPHTWNADDAQKGGGKDNQSRDGYYRGPRWYRRELEIPEGFSGRRVFLRFEGVGSVADCYLNGIHLGQHRGAFGAFCFEIGEKPVDDQCTVIWAKIELQEGNNHILVEATRNGKLLANSCVWTLRRPPALAEPSLEPARKK